MGAGEFTDAMDGSVKIKALSTDVALTFAIIAVVFCGINFLLMVFSAFIPSRVFRGRLGLSRVPVFLGTFALFVFFVMAYVGQGVWVTATDSLEVPFWVFTAAGIALSMLWGRDQAMIGTENITPDARPPISLQGYTASVIAQIEGWPRGLVFTAAIAALFVLMQFATWDVTNVSPYMPEIMWFGIAGCVVLVGILIIWGVNLMDLFRWRKMFNMGTRDKRNSPNNRYMRRRYTAFIVYQFFILLELLAIAVVYIIGPNLSQAVTSNDNIMIGFGVLFLTPYLAELIFYAYVGWQRASLPSKYGGAGNVMKRAVASPADREMDTGYPRGMSGKTNLSYDHSD